MEAANPSSKRPRDESAAPAESSTSPERTASVAGCCVGACPTKRVATEAPSPSRKPRLCGQTTLGAPEPQEKGDEPTCDDVDVEELLLKALEDELESRTKSVGGGVNTSVEAAKSAASWVPIVEEDDNYDESDDES
ncbi:hypothetical protein FI667_g12934, partial [Globisporangium splendens]